MARDYTDVDKSELLIEVAKYGGPTAKAQRATGVHQRTLQRWWDALTEDERQDFMLEAKKRQEAYWQELHDACLQVARDKVNEMSARDALVGAGISFDKLRLIRGEATDIAGTLSSDADALAREVEGILAKVTSDASREVIGDR
jgi:transposase-like protein